MKRIFALFFCLLLAAALTAPALADLIWMPDDDFYYEHIDECRLEGGTFTAETDTAVCRSPEDTAAVAVLHAGETRDVGCYYTDKDGNEWAYVDFYDGTWVKGWIDLSDPGAAPKAALQTTPVVLVVGALAAAAIGILFLRPKKR